MLNVVHYLVSLSGYHCQISYNQSISKGVNSVRASWNLFANVGNIWWNLVTSLISSNIANRKCTNLQNS